MPVVFLNADRTPGTPLVEPDAEQVARRAPGAAFQKINFLRDLLDAGEPGLHRTSVGTERGRLSSRRSAYVLDEIAHDVAVARAALPRLPGRSRYAVAATPALYDWLLGRPAPHSRSTRLCVPGRASWRCRKVVAAGGREWWTCDAEVKEVTTAPRTCPAWASSPCWRAWTAGRAASS